MLLKLSNIVKEYPHKDGKVYALNNVSLQMDEGDFVAVTGASGSGKTTLLLIIGGLLHASSGTMQFNELPIRLNNDDELATFRNANVGFIMQHFALIPYLTAAENVVLALHDKKMNGKDKATRAAELLNWVGLEHRKNHYPKELSAGQQQRVAIARALANRPALLLADEPTGNLDPTLAKEILDLLQKINNDNKTTIIMVTHSDLAASYGNRHVRIDNGRIM